MSVESFTPTALQFTHGAAHKVKSLVDEEGSAYSLRAAVVQVFSTASPSMKKWPMTTPSSSAKV